jgi:hypothetical protein
MREHHPIRRLLLLTVTLGLVALLSNNVGAVVLSDGDHIFRIRIEANKNIYSVGEPIQLRAWITNTTGEEYGIDNVPPWALFRLVVLNGNGKRLVGAGLGPARVGWAPWIFKPGETQVASYQDPTSPRQMRQWADISHWGYTITRAGNYTLAAYLATRGYRKAAGGIDTFVTSGNTPSNTVHITFTP